MSTADLFCERADQAVAVFTALREDYVLHGAVDAAAQAVVATLGAGGRVLLCGNGGSAADAQHLAAELVGRFTMDREPFAAIALGDSTAAVTAIGNDYGFDEVFVRGVNAHGRAGDVLVGMSTSGRSFNLVAAFRAARARAMLSVAFVGGGNPPLAQAADVVLRIDAASPARIQEAHLFLGHTICEIVERQLCG